MLLIIVLVNKFEREHSEQNKKKKKQETLICKCVFSEEKKPSLSVSAVDRVMGRRAPILFALQIKEKICIPSTSDFYKFSFQESDRLKINGMCGQK